MKARILVIDDEENIRFTFERFLLDEGYEVETASNYDEAMSIINKSDIDLIFADVVLEGKSGINILKEVVERNLKCPVIMITGLPDSEIPLEALRLGAFVSISKPVRQETLLHVTKIALRYSIMQHRQQKKRSVVESLS